MEISTAADNIHLLTQPAVWVIRSRIALFQENEDDLGENCLWRIIQRFMI